MATLSTRDLRSRRHRRLRQKVRGNAARPRMCVKRTLRHLHVQLIDDERGVTLAAVSTVQPDVAAAVEGGKGSRAAAQVVGAALAAKAKARGIESVVLDRAGDQYHGVIKELAEAARAAGLAF